MQPPPRKGGSVKFLKNLHAEQIAKLQVKNQTECELLEDLRSFILKKSALEKSYCEALLKITSVYLNKKITTSIPDLKTEGSDERWNMWSVWRTVLEENETLSRARLATLEVFSQQIADDSKHLRYHKLQTTKKCVDLLASIQKEVQCTVQDVEKTKKIYFDEEHCAHDVRDKAKDIEARLKRKKGSFFQSLSTLQKSSAKVSLKREQLDDKSVGARNDYLLSLATANAHQTRYFVNDLQNIMQIMESEVYEKVQQYFCLIGRAELLTCSARQASYTKIRDQSQKLTRDYNLQCLYLYYPVLKQHIQYEFEACEGDSIDYITSSSANTPQQQQFIDEVRDWLEIVWKEKSSIRSNTKKLKNLLSLRESGERSDPFDPNGPDIDTRIEELQESLRKSVVAKVKTEAKVDLLKKSQDENIREMCSKLEEELGANYAIDEDDVEDDDDLEAKENIEQVQRSSITISNKQQSEVEFSSEEEISYPPVEKTVTFEDEVNTNTHFTHYSTTTGGQSDDVLKQFQASWDDTGDDELSTSNCTLQSESPAQQNIYRPEDEAAPPAVASNVSYEEFETPLKCVVLYNYAAQNLDELSITAGEELQILGEGDGDGWLRARDSGGNEGFVPCTYLDSYSAPGEEDTPEQYEQGMSMSGGHHLTSQISFSSVDYTVNTTPPSIKRTVTGGDSGDSSVSAVTVLHEIDTDINQAYPDDGEVNQLGTVDAEYCIALYDYEANSHDELTFREGQVIHVLRKIVHDGIDDGWWEGEIDDKVGIFPSLMVETCLEDGTAYDEDGAVPMSAPPLFTPPEVPEYEFTVEGPHSTAVPKELLNENGNMEKFSFQMPDNQQKHYETQFGEEISDDNLSEEAANKLSLKSEEIKSQVESESTVPDISINVVCDEDDIDINKDKAAPIVSINVIDDDGGDDRENDGDAVENDFNLGVTQIVITAPTPSSDSSEKSFQPPPSASTQDDSQMTVSAALLERRKSAGEINEADPPLYDASLINECLDYPTTIIEEPEEEEEEEEKYNEGNNPQTESSKTKDPTTSPSGPCTQCVPEQLEPDQLQKLQQLKESNA